MRTPRKYLLHEIERRWRAGEHSHRIGAALDMHPAYVRTMIQRYLPELVRSREIGLSGRVIVAAYRMAPATVVAKRFGCSVGTVYNILARAGEPRTWQHKRAAARARAALGLPVTP